MSKGSGRRPGEGYAANWDAIFGKRKSDEVKGKAEPAQDGGEAQKRNGETSEVKDER